MQVKIKILEGGQKPTKGTEGAAAYDCYARDSALVGGRAILIGLGFCIELPQGYHAEILPRSSTGLRTPLRQPNCLGIIDSDYRGEVKAMYELSPRENLAYKVQKGDKIAQMIIKKNEDVELVEAETLSETKRGTNGFGSTGK